jgi:transposase-like protein
MQRKPLEVVSSPSAVKQYHRRTASQWRDLMTLYENSGLNQLVFCQQHGIVLSTFYRWRKKLSEQALTDTPPEPHQFVELTPSTVNTPANNDWDVALALANGMTLRLRT